MPKTSLGTNVYGPDPSFVEGLSNIAAMFDPKAEAQGALAKAHSNYYGEAAREKAAQAELLANRNSALNDSYLAGAGYNPQQIAAMRAAQSNSVADIFRGVNENNGANMLSTDPRMGLMLMDQASAATQPDAVFSQAGADAYNQMKLPNAKGDAVNLKVPYSMKDIELARTQIRDRMAVDGIYPGDADIVYPIIDKAQELIQSGKSTRASAIADAFNELGWQSQGAIQGSNPWFGKDERKIVPIPIQPTPAGESPVAPLQPIAQSAPVAPQAQAPTQYAVIKPTTQAEIDNAPSGSIIEVNGKRFRKP